MGSDEGQLWRLEQTLQAWLEADLKNLSQDILNTDVYNIVHTVLKCSTYALLVYIFPLFHFYF